MDTFSFSFLKTKAVLSRPIPFRNKKEDRLGTDKSHPLIAAIAPSPQDPAFSFGPYLRGDFPDQTIESHAGENLVKIKDNKAPLTAEPAEDWGWQYNCATGQIIANSNDMGADGKLYSEY